MVLGGVAVDPIISSRWEALSKMRSTSNNGSSTLVSGIGLRYSNACVSMLTLFWQLLT